MQNGTWTFLTNHAHVFYYITKYTRSTTREVAQVTGITERTVQKIIADLEEEGYIVRRREGRRNRYEVHSELPLRHPLEREHAVGDLLQALGYRTKGNTDSR